MNKLLPISLLILLATTSGAPPCHAQRGGRQNAQKGETRLDYFTGTGRQEDFEAAMRHERPGWAAFRNNDWTSAISEFRAATNKYPNLPAAYWGIGMCLEKTGDNAGAEEAYRTSLKYNSDSWKCWKRLANLLYGDRNYTDARKALANAVSLNPPRAARREIDLMIRDVEAAQKQ